MSSPERPRSLRATLALRIGLTITLAMGGLFALIDHLVDAELYRRFDAALAARAQALALYLGASGAGARAPIETLMPQFRGQAHEEFYQVWDGHGAVLARSAASRGRDLTRPGEVSAAGSFYDLALPDGILTPRERLVIESLYLDDLSVGELEKSLGVGRQAIYNLKCSGINKLRRPFRPKPPQEGADE